MLPVDGERLPRLLLFGHADDAGRRPAWTPHAATPPSSTAAPLSPYSHPARLPRRTAHLLVVVQHAPAAHGQDAPARTHGGTDDAHDDAEKVEDEQLPQRLWGRVWRLCSDRENKSGRADL